MAMHTELWFPQVIWSAVVNKIHNVELEQFAYEKQKNDKGRVISNYGGWQSNDLNSGENSQFDNLIAYLNQEVNQCAKQVGLKPLELYNIWININPPGSYNNLHNHVGSVLSGVYYVSSEETQGNIQFERSDQAEYHIPVEVEKETYFTSTKCTYKAKTGALYIFPGWLKHNVQGNFSNKDRISISFNYGEKK